MFEQGKLLAVPETVPFRLTPDIVDGLGVNGTTGLFLKSIQACLEVLKRHNEMILFLVERIRYDPPRKLFVSEAGGNELIRHAILSVKTKLTSSLSAQRQAKKLIKDATDAEKLAQMFPGFQSWE